MAKVISDFSKKRRVLSDSFFLSGFGSDKLKQLENQHLIGTVKDPSILRKAGRSF